jgi:hypothetical protein
MSKPNSRVSAAPEASGRGEAEGQRCDFCGDVVIAVRRVALDVEYDRLQKIHKEQYSCHSCFEAKEDQRMGMTRR